MRTKISILLSLLVSAVLLCGCQTTLTVHDATSQNVISAFRDYVGMHGYSLTYQNDKTGSYNVNMGSVFITGTSSATKSKSTSSYTAPAGSGQAMTAYEQTSWNTVNDPARYAQASAAVSITQKGSDVAVFIDTNDAGGTSLNDIKDYIQSLGYKVD